MQQNFEFFLKRMDVEKGADVMSHACAKARAGCSLRLGMDACFSVVTRRMCDAQQNGQLVDKTVCLCCVC